MNTMTKFAAAAASLVAFAAAAPAAQATVYLGLDNGGGIVTVDSGALGAFYANAFGTFEFTVDSGTAGTFPQLLASTSHTNNNAGGDAGTLDVYATVDGLTGSIPKHFLSSFTSNVMPAGWSVRLRTYVDTGNGLFGGTLLADNTYTGLDSEDFHNGFVGGAGPYSVTARYTIVAPTQGDTLATISLGAVPEPGTWALMIMGFGGAGAMLRSRRKDLVSA